MRTGMIRFVLLVVISVVMMAGVAWAEDATIVDELQVDVKNNRNTSSNNQSRIQSLELLVADLQAQMNEIQTSGNVSSITAGGGLSASANTGDVTLGIDFEGLVTDTGILIQSTTDGVSIEAGQAQIMLDFSGNIIIKSYGNLTLEAIDGDLSLRSARAVNIQAGEDVNILAGLNLNLGTGFDMILGIGRDKVANIVRDNKVTAVGDISFAAQNTNISSIEWTRLESKDTSILSSSDTYMQSTLGLTRINDSIGTCCP